MGTAPYGGQPSFRSHAASLSLRRPMPRHPREARPRRALLANVPLLLDAFITLAGAVFGGHPRMADLTVLLVAATVVGVALAVFGYGANERREASKWSRENRSDADATATRLKERFHEALHAEVVRIVDAARAGAPTLTVEALRSAIRQATKGGESSEASVDKMSKTLSSSRDVLRLHKEVEDETRAYGNSLMRIGVLVTIGTALTTFFFEFAEGQLAAIWQALGALAIFAFGMSVYSIAIEARTHWKKADASETRFLGVVREVREQDVRL